MADGLPILITGLHNEPVALAALPPVPGCGAEACFVGRTRAQTHPQHGALLRLDYEAYADMAETMLAALARETAERFGAHAVKIIHATGPVAVGEASVVIQVATPHRADAFAGCQHAIDALKQNLPIWKREVWEHGTTFPDGTPPPAAPPTAAPAPAASSTAPPAASPAVSSTTSSATPTAAPETPS